MTFEVSFLGHARATAQLSVERALHTMHVHTIHQRILLCQSHN